MAVEPFPQRTVTARAVDSWGPWDPLSGPCTLCRQLAPFQMPGLWIREPRDSGDLGVRTTISEQKAPSCGGHAGV